MIYPKAVAEGWHPVATLAQLKRKPLARMLMGRPLVVFAGSDRPAVLADRCPHRNMALSLGRVRAGEIECPYHGWRFARDGRCTLTPGADQPARQSAEALPVVVKHGLVFTTLAQRPSDAPVFPHPVGDERFDTFLWSIKPTRARLVDAIENLLDPAHPHFLHAGIVRSGTTRRKAEVTVRLGPASAEAVYVENSRAQALMPRVLEGQRTASVGRFFLPSIGQVAFENSDGVKLAITVYFVPEGPERVRPYAHFATQKRLTPAWLKRWALLAFDAVILAQDQRALKRQAENIARFGGPKYALGPLDVLFPAIQSLLAGEEVAAEERKLELQL